MILAVSPGLQFAHRFMRPIPVTVTTAPSTVRLEGRCPRTHISNGSEKSGAVDERTFPTATPAYLIPAVKSSDPTPLLQFRQ